MKKIVLFSVLLAFCACGVKPMPLSWSADTIRIDDSLFYVDISYPVALGESAVADSINRVVRETICTALISDNNTPPKDSSVMGWIDRLRSEKMAEPYLQTIPYDLRGMGRVYVRDGVISLFLQNYTYQGGAHGMTFNRYLNFNSTTGLPLHLQDLISDTLALAKLNIAAFSHFLAEKQLAADQITLFVDRDALPLPQEIGLDSTGMVMQYNQYEIAPYSFGAPAYTIPYTDLTAILTPLITE